MALEKTLSTNFKELTEKANLLHKNLTQAQEQNNQLTQQNQHLLELKGECIQLLKTTLKTMEKLIEQVKTNNKDKQTVKKVLVYYTSVSLPLMACSLLGIIPGFILSSVIGGAAYFPLARNYLTTKIPQVEILTGLPQVN